MTCGYNIILKLQNRNINIILIYSIENTNNENIVRDAKKFIKYKLQV